MYIIVTLANVIIAGDNNCSNDNFSSDDLLHRQLFLTVGDNCSEAEEII